MMATNRSTHLAPFIVYSGPRKASTFPEFDDADVHIIITGSRQYKLHSSILKSVSSTLCEILTDDRAAKLNKGAIKRGVTVRYRLLLASTTTPEFRGPDKTSHVLKPVHLGEDGKPLNGNPIALDLENGRVVPPFVVAYHAVLGAIYNLPIDFGDFAEEDDLYNVLFNALQIIEVAEYLGCIHIITKPIEATLLGMGQVLHRSIANNPPAWLDFAHRVQSRVIFREALIHGAGQYNTLAMQEALKTMSRSVAEILIKKGKALQEAVRTAAYKIISYYPSHMQRERTVGRADKDSIGRASYANDIMSWIALVVLRQWLAQAQIGDETYASADLGKKFVDYIVEGGEKYLNKPELEPFHAYFPMSAKGKAVLESHLANMKEHIKRFVQDFTANESQLDPSGYPVKYFLCTIIHPTSDYPWDFGYSSTGNANEDDEDEAMGNADTDEDEGDEAISRDANDSEVSA